MRQKLRWAESYFHRLKKKKIRRPQKPKPPPKPPKPKPVVLPVSHPQWHARGIGVVVTNGNIGPSELAKWGISHVLLHITEGLDLINPDEVRYLVQAYKSAGFLVGGWGRTYARDPKEEGRVLAQACVDYAMDSIGPNFEDEYGDYRSQEHYNRLVQYCEGMNSAWSLDRPRAALVTPFWIGHHNVLQVNNFCLMQEAFSAEVPRATIENCYRHATEQVEPHWHRRDLIPLIQAYPTDGQYPNSIEYLNQALSAGVQVAPFAPESSLDKPLYLASLSPVIKP